MDRIPKALGGTDGAHPSPLQSPHSTFDILRPPLVSIIVTNYNYEQYIGDCLRSIAAQTYANTEVIIVDDVSTDGSVVSIRQFIATNPAAAGFKLVALEKNGGQMNAFAEGLQHASGVFVVFVDADDLLFPDFVETHVQAHLNHDYVAGMSCSNEVLIDQDNQVLASSIEKWHRSKRAETQLAPGIPVYAARVDDWQRSWAFGVPNADGGAEIAPHSQPLLFIEPDDNQHKIWFWSTTSAIMFRRSVLDVALTEDIRDIRICADYYLLHFCHLIGGTLLIQSPHGAYRRHGNNNFARNLTIGRGSKAGTTGDGLTFDQLHDRIERTFFDDYDRLSELAGEPRIMQILAHLVPLRHLPRALGRVGKGQPSAKIQFLVMFIIRYLRRKFNVLRRKLRFA